MKQDIQDKPTFFKKIEADIIKWIIGGVVTIILGGVTFYYNTNNTLKAHGSSFEKMEGRMSNVEKLVNKMASNPELVNAQINAIEKAVEDLKQRQIKSEENSNVKFDKIYDAIISLSKR
jgi:K+/H+ antiporter YhaU regulatory subunit KhtT